MRGQMHHLELVYPPISNQEAEWVKNDPSVQSQVANSNLYFIGQKPEAFYEFDNDVLDKIIAESKIYFTYTSGGKSDRGFINLEALLILRELPVTSTLDIELGEKMIRIWLEDQSQNNLLDWLTTDKILYDKSKGFNHINGLDKYRDFFKYYLHYVGISKRENSLKRLVIKPHDKRLRILSNEHPLNTSSRVTDEIVLFFFRIKSLEIMQYLNEDDFEEFGKNELEDYTKIISDAEKAFVKIMDTNYNEVKFNDYPFSTDGLFGTSVEKHTFSIGEDIEFITDKTTIRGARQRYPPQREGDFIAVSKENVELIKVD